MKVFTGMTLPLMLVLVFPGLARSESTELRCPSQNYYASPLIETKVRNDEKSYLYEYSIDFGEAEGEDPLVSLRIEGLENDNTELLSWSGDFKSCRFLIGDGAVSCWTSPVKKTDVFRERTGKLTIKSSYGAGVGRYIAQTFPWKGESGLNETNRRALLPAFDYNDEALTEAYFDQAMVACPGSAQHEKYSSAMTGFINVPSAADPMQEQQEAVQNIMISEVDRYELKNNSQEKEVRFDSLYRRIPADRSLSQLNDPAGCNVKGLLIKETDGTSKAYNVIDKQRCKKPQKTFNFKY